MLTKPSVVAAKLVCFHDLVFRQFLRYTAGVMVVLLTGAGAFCQSDSLALSSATTIPGGTASLTLALTSTADSQPAGLQWTVSYSTSAVTAVTATAGAASTAAGKSIVCAGSPGAYTCLLAGLNSNTVPNGVVAVIHVTVSTGTSTAAIGITNPLGSSAAGNLIPATAAGGVVTVVSLGLSALACNPTSLVSGNSSTCTVTLSEAAPSPGAAVSLSSNSAALSVPASVTVPSGASSATFTATAGTVATMQKATVTATLNGTSQQVSLFVASKLVISALGCNPSSLDSSGSSTCTITLNRTVYSSSGITVRLTGNNILLAIPSSAVVPTGANTVAFTATAGTIPTSQTATITASLGGSLETALLTLLPTGAAQPDLSFACDEPAVVGGVTTECSLQSSAPAATGGVHISLATSDSGMRVPASVHLPEGSRVARFVLQTRPTDHDHSGTILARTSTSVRQIRISVLALKPASLACTPHAGPAQGKLLCEVQLNARVNEPVSLAVSGSRNVLLPATIVTRPEQSNLTFEVTVKPSASAGEVSVQVAFGAQTAIDRRWMQSTSAVSLAAPVNIFAHFGELLDFALSSTEPGDIPTRLSAPELPSGARFDAATARFTWTPDRSQQGSHDLVFTALGAQETTASAHVRITVGSGEPVATALVNAASQSTDSVCSPGSVASLQGQWLNNASTPQVYVNGAAVPVRSASSTRVDFLCPEGAPGTQLYVWLKNAAGRTDSLATTLRNSAPGIFTLTSSTQGLIFFNNSLLAAVRSFAAPGQPAQPGDDISIRATGLSSDAVITAKLGDVDAPVAAVQPVDSLPGIYDIRVKVPAGAPCGEAVPVRLRIGDGGGVWSDSNLATMAIELPRP